MFLETAQRLANEGFLVVLPDLFYYARPYGPDSQGVTGSGKASGPRQAHFNSIEKSEATNDTVARWLAFILARGLAG